MSAKFIYKTIYEMKKSLIKRGTIFCTLRDYQYKKRGGKRKESGKGGGKA